MTHLLRILEKRSVFYCYLDIHTAAISFPSTERSSLLPHSQRLSLSHLDKDSSNIFFSPRIPSKICSEAETNLLCFCPTLSGALDSRCVLPQRSLKSSSLTAKSLRTIRKWTHSQLRTQKAGSLDRRTSLQKLPLRISPLKLSPSSFNPPFFLWVCSQKSSPRSSTFSTLSRLSVSGLRAIPFERYLSGASDLPRFLSLKKRGKSAARSTTSLRSIHDIKLPST